MTIRSVDSNGDWEFGKGRQHYRRGVEGLKIHLETRLKSWKGDCFFDLLGGVDYNNFLDVGTREFLERDIKRVILQTQEVLRINNFSSVLDRVERNLTITAEIDTIYGILNQEVVV